MAEFAKGARFSDASPSALADLFFLANMHGAFAHADSKASVIESTRWFVVVHRWHQASPINMSAP